MMTITPVSNFSLKSNGSINFTRRHRDFEPDSVSYQPERSSGIAKKVPVIVLMAMSPLNSSSVEPYNPNYVPNNIEMVQQSSVKKGLVYKREMKYQDQQLRICGINDDKNLSTFEKIGFNYDCKKSNRHGVIDGYFIAICKESRNDGSYLIAYKEFEPDGKTSDFKLCYLPATFGENLYVMSTGVRNNGAMGVLPKSEFTDYFGKKNVENAPFIKDAVHNFVNK
jgi:hypothetical protein